MKTRQPILVAVLAVAAMAVQADPAGPPDAGAALAGLQAWLDGTKDLQARFEQQMLSGAFGDGSAERGRLWISRPGRMRWEYDEPEPKIAVIDGDRTWFYVEDERQLTLGRLDTDSELLPALLAGEARLASIFRASLAEPADGSQFVSLRLEPLRDAGSFEEVRVTLNASDYSIESAEVLDAAGNRVVYRFGRLRRNKGLDPDLFRFEPPPGTDVLGGHEPG